MKIALIICLLCSSQLVSSQSLPSQMYYSSDGRILCTGGQNPTGFYDYGIIRNVYFTFSQPDFWTRLTNNYASETLLAGKLTLDGVNYDVGIRFRGNTSYTSIPNSQKKSFAVETDFIFPDQTIMGFKNLKFNNAHDDPTFMREVLYNRLGRKYTPMAKANYIRLYINNQDWGIYANVQHTDKTFLKEWFLSNDGARFRATIEETGIPGGKWGDGTAGMNYLGADSMTYKKYYSLKSSDIDLPWQKLIDACYALSIANSINYASLPQKIDVDKALWFLAVENIFTDDDSYVMKGKMDYMVYYEPETGRTTPLEYDGNSTFVSANSASSIWGPFKNVSDVNYPLLNKLLNIPEYRQRYLAHYRTILNETFTTTNITTLVNQLNDQIASHVASDPKKLYSTAQYTGGYPALIAFVTTRRNYLLSNTEVAQVAPVISSASFSNSTGVQNKEPVAGEQIWVKAMVTSTTGISRVNLYYAAGIVGNFNVVEMQDNGKSNDGAAGDGVYGASIPGFAAGTFVRYYIEALANNSAKSAKYLPEGAEHDVFFYKVNTEVKANGVVVNELVAQNSTGTRDEAGDYDDWIELYNNNSYPVDLSGFNLSDNTSNLTKWQFPVGSVINPFDYMIIWADEEPAEGQLHANFKLSVSGESVTLSDPTLKVIDQVIFGQQQTDMAYARVPNGTGNWVIQKPSFKASNSLVTSVETSPTRSKAMVYPNPVSSKLTIHLAQGNTTPTACLFDLSGKVILTIPLTSGGEVDIGYLTKGIYLLRIGSETVKITKL